MSKSKAAKSRSRTSAPAPAPKPRGTQNPANLKRILENRAAKPRLEDLRVKKAAAIQLRAKLTQSDLHVVAEMSTKHAKRLQKQISNVETDYQARAAIGKATKAGKAKGNEAAIKILAAGRDELRATARKLNISGRSAMNIAELRSAIVKAAKKSGSKLGAFGLVAVPATAALTAYDATRSKASAAGLSDKAATLQAGKAAVVAGGVGAGIAAAASAAVKFGPKMLARAIPGVGLGLALEGAREGLEKHGPAGALFGALGLDDLAAMAKHKAEAVLLPPPSERHEAIVPRSSEFAKANATYHEMQAAAQRSTNTLRGWANPTTQAAAKAAQGKRYEPTR
jgi:hypothetical protein